MSGAPPPQAHPSMIWRSGVGPNPLIFDAQDDVLMPVASMRETATPLNMPPQRYDGRRYIHTEGPPDLARGFEAPDIAPMAPGPSQRAIGLASGLAGAGGMMSLAGGSQPVPQMTPAYPPMMTPMQQPSAPAPAPAPAPPLPSRPPVDEKKLEEEMLRALED
jgi:hypothetical protein